MLDRRELCIERLDLLRAGAVGFAHRCGVETLPRGLRDLLARRVLQPLEVLDLRNDPPPRRLERRELRERAVRIGAAIAQTGADLVDVIAHEDRIEHASPLYVTIPPWRLSGKPSSPRRG